MAFADFAPYLEATALGLLVGLERSWTSRRSEQQAAGTRTFAVLALAGAAAAAAGTNVVAGGTIAVGLLLTVGYLRTAHSDLGVSTESAAFATYLLGALALHHAALAVGIAVIMATVLAAKGPLHQFSREIVSAVEMTDALRFLVAAFVVLPLVPNRTLGPYGALNPFKIWLLVVTLTGIGWAGYIAVRALGPRRGLPITGFAGGFISATATTATFARTAKERPGLTAPALSGVLLASAATLLQLSLVLSVANREVLTRLAPAAVVGVTLLVLEAVVLLRRGGRAVAPESSAEAPRSEAGQEAGQQRPFRLAPALLLAAILTVVTLLARWASSLAGAGGAIGAAALAGFADAHAPSLAVATLAAAGAVSTHTAVLAAGCALAANTVAKVVLATSVGGRRFGLTFAAAMALPVAGTAAALAVALG